MGKDGERDGKKEGKDAAGTEVSSAVLCVRFLREGGGRTPFPLRFAKQSLRARSPLSRGTVIFFLRGVFKGGQLF